MAAHKHAALMMEYAKDAMETDKPWERWERQGADGTWYALNVVPMWLEDSSYRRKAKPFEGWVNIYQPTGVIFYDTYPTGSTGAIYDTKEKALHASMSNVVRTIRVREVPEDEK